MSSSTHQLSMSASHWWAANPLPSTQWYVTDVFRPISYSQICGEIGASLLQAGDVHVFWGLSFKLKSFCLGGMALLHISLFPGDYCKRKSPSDELNRQRRIFSTPLQQGSDTELNSKHTQIINDVQPLSKVRNQ